MRIRVSSLLFLRRSLSTFWGVFFVIQCILLLPGSSWGAPAQITNLMAVRGAQVELTWTAPDNEYGGACSSYLVKFSSITPISAEADFISAATFYQAWAPLAPGVTEQKFITGLIPDVTYWFSIKASSGAAWSAIPSTATSFATAGWFGDIVAGLTGVHYIFSSLAWGDYDNDGDLDLGLCGYTGSGRASRIYNNNAGTFTDSGAAIADTSDASISWGDYDNDGDLDLAMAGLTTTTGRISRIYRNSGGLFSDIGAGFTAVELSSMAWGDYDSDGDLDLALCGLGRISRIYGNNGGIFTDIVAGLTGVSDGCITWGDYDNDGDLDIGLSGYMGTSAIVFSRIYRNSGGA